MSVSKNRAEYWQHRVKNDEQVYCSCGGRYKKRLKNIHFKTQKHKLFNMLSNLYKFQGTLRDKQILCSCGGHYQTYTMGIHFKGEKHALFKFALLRKARKRGYVFDDSDIKSMFY